MLPGPSRSDPFWALHDTLHNLRPEPVECNAVGEWLVRGLIGVLSMLVRTLRNGVPLSRRMSEQLAESLRDVADVVESHKGC